jgi:hypothetical protein
MVRTEDANAFWLELAEISERLAGMQVLPPGDESLGDQYLGHLW